MSEELTRYLEGFWTKATAAGLSARKPGANWVAMAPLVRGSHVSLSVARHQIQVNLNNEDDGDRAKYLHLFADRGAVEAAIGEGLSWEKKDGRKKTAIRATREEGYADGNWDEQHGWAIAMIKAFEASFGARLR
ncbi:MAG: DUF4268 domain-containing protein [Alphaproteobacteria bacterium]|nr:MAG: DUF4268 domain-containing protein [Alphaproteobacteria bacterium]